MSEVKLILGDCMSVMKSIPDKSVDAILTDLPYQITACSWDKVIPFEPMWEQVRRVDKGVFVTTASQPFTSKLVMSNLDWFKYECIWEKNNGSGGMNANKMPIRKHENILVFYKKLPTYNSQLIKGNPYKIKRNKPGTDSVYGRTGVNDFFISKNNGIRYPTSCLYFSIETGNHPTQKPVALYEYLIRTYTNKGDTVLDLAMGSGTTGVACVQTGRNFIGIEISEQYFEIAEKRIHDAQQQMRIEFPE